MIRIFLLIIPLFFLTGCVSRFFSVGEELSRCEEIGCDYTDVGVCANPIEILQKKDNLREIEVRNEIKREAKNDKSFF